MVVVANTDTAERAKTTCKKRTEWNFAILQRRTDLRVVTTILIRVKWYAVKTSPSATVGRNRIQRVASPSPNYLHRDITRVLAVLATVISDDALNPIPLSVARSVGLLVFREPNAGTTFYNTR